jgi:hypothetical protein
VLFGTAVIRPVMAGCTPRSAGPAPARLRLDHVSGRKMPFMPQRSLDHNLSYRQGMVMRLREVLPRWSADAVAVVPAHR